jgi:hypothetical protein
MNQIEQLIKGLNIAIDRSDLHEDHKNELHRQVMNFNEAFYDYNVKEPEKPFSMPGDKPIEEPCISKEQESEEPPISEEPQIQGETETKPKRKYVRKQTEP